MFNNDVQIILQKYCSKNLIILLIFFNHFSLIRNNTELIFILIQMQEIKTKKI